MTHLTLSDDFTSARVRAFSSLTRQDAEHVRAAIRSAGGAYTVDAHDDYDGYLSLLLTPVDDDRPAILISGRNRAIDMALLDGDDLAQVGTFPTMSELVPVLTGLLARTMHLS